MKLKHPKSTSSSRNKKRHSPTRNQHQKQDEETENILRAVREIPLTKKLLHSLLSKNLLSNTSEKANALRAVAKSYRAL
eukprot:scaffold289_cov147-Amphora_coffeaeformis.AAC.7